MLLNNTDHTNDKSTREAWVQKFCFKLGCALYYLSGGVC